MRSEFHSAAEQELAAAVTLGELRGAYRADGEILRVIAVSHSRQKPDCWSAAAAGRSSSPGPGRPCRARGLCGISRLIRRGSGVASGGLFIARASSAPSDDTFTLRT